MTRTVVFFSAFALLTSAAFAHHGWGSYDANKPVTVTGPILTSKFENPHATITVRGSDKVWTVTLPTRSRCCSHFRSWSLVAISTSHFGSSPFALRSSAESWLGCKSISHSCNAKGLHPSRLRLLRAKLSRNSNQIDHGSLDWFPGMELAWNIQRGSSLRWAVVHSRTSRPFETAGLGEGIFLAALGSVQINCVFPRVVTLVLRYALRELNFSAIETFCDSTSNHFKRLAIS
jgi:hypothetical protein